MRSRLYRIALSQNEALKKLRKRNRFWGSVILGAFIGISLSVPAFRPRISSPVKPEPIEAKEVVETKATPKIDKIRRYNNYSHKPDYMNIISELQMLYFNWEDAADLNSYENGFNPMAVNPSSGACGLTQALPCSKMDCELGDIKCDLKFQRDYIARRYGTVSKALEFWYINNWY